MEKEIRKASLTKERGQTDSSLVSERGKTDDSFAGHRKQTESETDKRVKIDRQGADNARTHHRETTDATTDLAREGRTKIDHNRTTVEIEADDILHDQRIRDDAAVTFERNLMDAALVDERNLNDAESNKFLDRERKETDKNLLRERIHSDHESLESSNLLSDELSSHSLTKAALTSRDEFLAIVSHDLRNPVGTILSYADLLLEGTPRQDEESKRWARVIKRNAQTALRLISDILDMERFAEGKLTMNVSEGDVASLLSDTVESLSYSAHDKKIILSAKPYVCKRTVRFDKDRIEQVLTNLVSNALKFTPAGGKVTIEALEVGNNICISVADTGPGIPEEERKRIFERYTQIADKDRQGLGLGLYISTMLVEAHHGKIEVVSTLGKGSTFFFTLPLESA